MATKVHKITDRRRQQGHFRSQKTALETRTQKKLPCLQILQISNICTRSTVLYNNNIEHNIQIKVEGRLASRLLINLQGEVVSFLHQRYHHRQQTPLFIKFLITMPQYLRIMIHKD